MTPAKIASRAAKALGFHAGTICIENPRPSDSPEDKGDPLIAGGAVVRGRAADTLVEGLPRYPPSRFTECPFEDLRDPKRVHLDPFGHLHLCQGLSMGNIWKTPLGTVLEDWKPESHPVVGPLLSGGPAALAREHDVDPEPSGYVDACHLCYLARKSLMETFPDILVPPQVYGVET
jgi:hypothetical protein